jgi:hypothetical protein
MMTSGVVMGCTSTDDAGDVAEAPTYYQDIKPIMDAHCVGCHQEGAIGQGLLTDYANVAMRAPAIATAVTSRTMPPWLADADCNDYLHDPSLADDQVAAINAWVDAGTPEGEPSTATQALQGDGAESMSRIDHTLTMPVDYSPVLSPEDYRCFIVDWPEDQASFVTGIGFNPGNASTVHHIIAFLAPPGEVAKYEQLDAAEAGAGYTCYGGPGGEQDINTAFLGAWAPGAGAYDFPAGTGVPVEPGSKIIMQVHYNLVTWDGEPDRTSIDVMVDTSVEREAQWAFFADPTWFFGGEMPIPAGDPDVVHTFSMDPTGYIGGDFDVYQVGVHMHTRGTKATFDVVRPDESEQCVLDVPRWDFDWQFPYRLQEPVRVSEGDQLRITCHWDNSPGNQPFVGGMQTPPVDINWGDGTKDEMCLGLVYVTTDL